VRDIPWKWGMAEKGEICLLKTYYMSILTYGAETLTWTKPDISRLMVAEMKF
jgi:hypothetical protein